MSHPENTLKEIIQKQSKEIADLNDIVIGLAAYCTNLIPMLFEKQLITKEQSYALLDCIQDRCKERNDTL